MPCFLISKSIARATMSRGASSPRASCCGMKRVPSGRRRMPPSPRTASEIRNDLACGWYRQVGMELDEFHVGDARPGAPAHGDPVAGGDVRVGGVQVHLARAAGGEDGRARRDRPHVPCADVEHVGAERPVGAACVAQLARCDKVDRDVPLEDLDVGVALHLPDERLLHRAAGGVRGMHDAPVAVAALAREVQLLLVGVVAREGDPLLDEPFDRPAAALDHEAHRVLVAKAGARHLGVADVVLDGVGPVEHRGNAPLGPARRPAQQLVLGDQGHLLALGEPQCRGHAREAAADHQDVVALHAGREDGMVLGPPRRGPESAPGQELFGGAPVTKLTFRRRTPKE